MYSKIRVLVGAVGVCGLVHSQISKGSVSPWDAIILGALMNIVVVMANGWRMPFSPRGGEENCMYVKIHPGTRLRLLGDIIPIRIGYFKVFASIGDVLIMSGWSGLMAIKIARW